MSYLDLISAVMIHSGKEGVEEEAGLVASGNCRGVVWCSVVKAHVQCTLALSRLMHVYIVQVMCFKYIK